MNEECIPGHGRDCMCDDCREYALGPAPSATPMPDERTPSQIADEHDALRAALEWVAKRSHEAVLHDNLLIGALGEIEDHARAALANDDAAMCAAVRALEAENARLRAVLAALAPPDPICDADEGDCIYCGEDPDEEHGEDCPWLLARAAIDEAPQ